MYGEKENLANRAMTYAFNNSFPTGDLGDNNGVKGKGMCLGGVSMCNICHPHSLNESRN